MELASLSVSAVIIGAIAVTMSLKGCGRDADGPCRQATECDSVTECVEIAIGNRQDSSVADVKKKKPRKTPKSKKISKPTERNYIDELTDE